MLCGIPSRVGFCAVRDNGRISTVEAAEGAASHAMAQHKPRGMKRGVPLYHDWRRGRRPRPMTGFQ